MTPINAKVEVQGNLDKALRQLKKKMEKEGLVKDMKRNMYYEKPTQRRRKSLLKAIKQQSQIRKEEV
ncbi:MAG: 30S ribosomal protein S21 [Candidatus Schekmanbacteria bacterium RIFCSPHIGHO2_02_FULL_38_11]|uniref:Small ribosomal subunit protein bS21 n=1 Tax=Candidatus Schekmanbacteria bacterium RIFCSPLOWO2_12_FULL_38_15 TaxID=1817883 RepID=A0A1F7SKX4_9BACT|nr:MAG: 30S ribosomal protein S21 [Candidatus Schekmanbacteria bacterium GWA2_38_9]OGL48194.1 MAG: 30S ribosomal protein S21 [Candidatus Schekmanbacteria bacterium RIFCSPLOWO2_02_FULL_38_14]OGL54423.1 MAG: 30S ribosomal protein S21 [Candidatus Schekmanbacteria bacterium RIFCSPLOWO2_12_FULL_38_15]OGL54640.1 MAG: 30S ribosomal protein S21 [Candidatus Schekmanbacteria bacterium RIFCSPHIGHO2_02_FULL_38_11]